MESNLTSYVLDLNISLESLLDTLCRGAAFKIQVSSLNFSLFPKSNFSA
jgi:hypothetical protein